MYKRQRYDLEERLTVPDGTSTMVAIINEKVDGEETFLFLSLIHISEPTRPY